MVYVVLMPQNKIRYSINLILNAIQISTVIIDKGFKLQDRDFPICPWNKMCHHPTLSQQLGQGMSQDMLIGMLGELQDGPIPTLETVPYPSVPRDVPHCFKTMHEQQQNKIRNPNNCHRLAKHEHTIYCYQFPFWFCRSWCGPHPCK